MVDAVHGADGAEALYDVTPLSALVDASLAPRHLLVWMLSLFGGLALFLAAIGIYGLLSFLATQRTVEVGVRMALGANRVDIAYLIARRILPLLAAGLGVGSSAGRHCAANAHALLRCALRRQHLLHRGRCRRAAAGRHDRCAVAGVARSATPTLGRAAQRVASISWCARSQTASRCGR